MHVRPLTNSVPAVLANRRLEQNRRFQTGPWAYAPGLPGLSKARNEVQGTCEFVFLHNVSCIVGERRTHNYFQTVFVNLLFDTREHVKHLQQRKSAEHVGISLGTAQSTALVRTPGVAMANSGRGSSSNISAMRKKRRTIGGFRAHAMGDSFDHSSTADASANFSLSMVPEDQLSCTGAGSEHIVVAVRVRPLSAAELAEGKRSCCEVLTSNTLVIRKGADPGAYLRSQQVRYAVRTSRCTQRVFRCFSRHLRVPVICGVCYQGKKNTSKAKVGRTRIYLVVAEAIHASVRKI